MKEKCLILCHVVWSALPTTTKNKNIVLFPECML
jgi:hypothetical protein